MPHKVMVNLSAMTCSYNEWQVTGLPCRHACACHAHNRQQPKDYVEPLLTLETWRKAYEPHIESITGEDDWKSVEVNRLSHPLSREVNPEDRNNNKGRTTLLHQRKPESQREGGRGAWQVTITSDHVPLHHSLDHVLR